MPAHPRATRAITVAATVAACFAAAAVPATPALGDDTSSPAPRMIRVSGTLEPVNGSTTVYTAKGDLDGTWRFPAAQATDYYSNPELAIIQRGTESFTGCLTRVQRRCGTFNSDYILWSFLDGDGRLIKGGCTHAPTGGTSRRGNRGGFVGVRGLLQMEDLPVGSGVVTTYDGQIILDATPGEGPKPIPTTTTSTTTSTTASTTGTARTASVSC